MIYYVDLVVFTMEEIYLEYRIFNIQTFSNLDIEPDLKLSTPVEAKNVWGLWADITIKNEKL